MVHEEGAMFCRGDKGVKMAKLFMREYRVGGWSTNVHETVARGTGVRVMLRAGYVWLWLPERHDRVTSWDLFTVRKALEWAVGPRMGSAWNQCALKNYKRKKVDDWMGDWSTNGSRSVLLTPKQSQVGYSGMGMLPLDSSQLGPNANYPLKISPFPRLTLPKSAFSQLSHFSKVYPTPLI
jgi:hypothetical protein